MWRAWIAIVCVGALVCGCERKESTATTGPVASTRAAGATRTIAVIPKGTTHEFWKSIHAGANKAAQETGCQILWKGPEKEDEAAAQTGVVEDMINTGV